MQAELQTTKYENWEQLYILCSFFSEFDVRNHLNIFKFFEIGIPILHFV